MEGIRHPQSLLDEVDYWREVLNISEHIVLDTTKVAVAVGDAQKRIATATIDHIDGHLDLLGLAEAITGANARVLDVMLQMQERVNSIVRLSSGRVTALRAEGGLPPKEGGSL